MKIKLPQGFFPDKQYVSLVAIDPGKTIGVAVTTLLRCGNEQLPGKPTEWDVQIVTSAIEWPTDVAVLRDTVLPLADILVVEDWRLRKDTAQQMIGQVLWGPEVIGSIKDYLTYHNQYAKLHFQSPHEKEGIDGYIRKRIDWPPNPHQQDALRHLVRFLLKAKDRYRSK